MIAATRHDPIHSQPPSIVSILSGWAQQGVRTFFATQRILLDLAVRQNANVMHVIREQLSDPHHSPTAILGEIASEGIENFIAGQKVLLELGKQENAILMAGAKEYIGECPRRQAAVDLLRRSVDTFIHMQEEFLKMAGKQTHAWIETTKAGKPYQPEHIIDLARDSMDNFVKTQKQFLDIVAEETAHATSGKRADGVRKMKKTELREIARQATESFIDAQKKLVDVVGQQMNTNVKTAGRTLDMMQPLPFLPLGELTREAVKSHVDAQKALMEVIARPNGHEHPAKPAPRHVKRTVRGTKKTTVAATA